MKLLNKILRPRGLRAKFGLSLLGAAILSIVVFFVLYLFVDTLLLNFFENMEFEKSHRDQLAESLQEYLLEEEAGLDNLEIIENWEKHKPLLLLEIYDGKNCIFSTFHENKTKRNRWYSNLENSLVMDSDYTYVINLKDATVRAVIYSDYTYKYYVIATAFAFGIALMVFVSLFVYSTGQLIRYICRLEEEIEILEGGNLEYQVTEQGNDELTDLARSMNRMRLSFLEQMKKEQELQSTNRRLITEMSHDLRTPLTGLMLYTEILRFHRYENEADLQEYLEKIDRKAHHLKQLSDHLFEYAQEGKREEHREKCSFQECFEESVENMITELKAGSFSVDQELSWNAYPILADKATVERIIGNITSNIVKYARKDVPVRIETLYHNNYCGLIFMNTIAEEERQVESSGIGMESVQTLVKEMNGICTVEETESVFEISIQFPVRYGTA